MDDVAPSAVLDRLMVPNQDAAQYGHHHVGPVSGAEFQRFLRGRVEPRRNSVQSSKSKIGENRWR